jgi:hypothetical protein
MNLINLGSDLTNFKFYKKPKKDKNAQFVQPIKEFKEFEYIPQDQSFNFQKKKFILSEKFKDLIVKGNKEEFSESYKDEKKRFKRFSESKKLFRY